MKDAVFVGTGEVAGWRWGGVGLGAKPRRPGHGDGTRCVLLSQELDCLHFAVTGTGLFAFCCHINWTVCILLS